FYHRPADWPPVERRQSAAQTHPPRGRRLSPRRPHVFWLELRFDPLGGAVFSQNALLGSPRGVLRSLVPSRCGGAVLWTTTSSESDRVGIGQRLLPRVPRR